MMLSNLVTSPKPFRNLPWGETDVEQNTGQYDNPYKFNGKELDEEIDAGDSPRPFNK